MMIDKWYLMGDKNMLKNKKRVFPKGYASGKYAVGTKCFSIVDKGRKEILGDGNEKRKIAIRMYYPVDKENVVRKKYAAIFSEKKR